MSESILKKTEAEIAQKKLLLAVMQNELEVLERLAIVLRAIPNYTLADLEMAIQAARRLSGESSLDHRTVSPAPPDTNGSHVPQTNGTHSPLFPPSVSANDMGGKTILEAAVQLLRENGGSPVHFRKLAEEAMRRGYSSGRRDSNTTKIVRSFGQTLGRIAMMEDGGVERVKEGEFQLRTKVKTGEG